MESKKTRQSNFELLRVFSMYIILLHHLIIHGVMQGFKGGAYSSLWMYGSKINQFFLWFFFPGGEVGVALFFMISGYFLITSNKLNIKKTILQTVYYGWFTVFLFFITSLIMHFSDLGNVYSYMTNKELTRELIFNIFAPLRSGQFWFVTAYVILLLLKPLYNEFLNKFNRNGYLIFLLFFWLFGLVFSTYFEIVLGYTKAFFFYALGGYIRLFMADKKISKGSNYGLFIMGCLLWAVYAVIRYIANIVNFNGIIGKIFGLINFFVPSCILVVIIGICFFIFFMNLNIGNKKYINIIASTTFGIYLIHEGTFTRGIIWDVVLKVSTIMYQSSLFPIIAILSTVILFVVCSILDYFRICLIESRYITFTDKIVEKLKEKFYLEQK